MILIFMQDQALKNFRDSDGWKVGVDGSVAIVKVGAGGAIDSETLEGSKITKLKR